MPARIVALAGVNGAGKSSVAGAAILAGHGEFYNPDKTAGESLRGNPAWTPADANGRAWELGRRGLERALSQGGFFAFETTLGGRTITAMLISGAGRGAEIHVSYIGLESLELHIERVRRRVAAGGHDIPEAKIRERYRTSRENLIRLMPCLTSLRVYDNSAEARPRPAPRLLLQRGGTTGRHAPLDQIPAWAKPLLAAAFKLDPKR